MRRGFVAERMSEARMRARRWRCSIAIATVACARVPTPIDATHASARHSSPGRMQCA
jgi:hypothetical protein